MQIAGFAVGGNGDIIKTTNAGTTWTKINLSIDDNLTSIYFADANVGYIIGYEGTLTYGTILKTTNGGTSWTVISSETYDVLHTVYFKDANNGFAAGENGNIIKTTDGGITWTYANASSYYTIFSMTFTDANTGFCVGGISSDCAIQKTTDGGNTWNDQSVYNLHSLYSVYFVNSNFGYAVGDNGLAYKTTNGGGYTAINEISNTSANIITYPNPFKDVLTIETNLNTEQRLDIVNMVGQTVYTSYITKKTTINTSAFQSGVYIIKLYTYKDTVVKKFVKE